MPAFVRTTRLTQRSVSSSEVRRRANQMLGALGLKRSELSILLCDDTTIRRLNRQYRKRDRATDVLAFSQQEGEAAPAGALLGDIVISMPTARRQALRAHRSIRAEVTMLVAHGLLHLLGYDHGTSAEDRRMRAKVDVLCAAAAAR